MSYDVVPFVQFKKYENHSWKSAVYNFTTSNTPPWVFFSFLKVYKWYQIVQHITNIDRVKIRFGANPFLLLWCIEIKNKEKNKLP